MIGVDWGSSRFRAWLIRADGTTATLRFDEGIVFDRPAALADRLAVLLAAWLTEIPAPDLIVGVGMVGSRTGIVDAGYVSTPASYEDWCAGAVSAGGVGGVPLIIMPGVIDEGSTRVDVMRGEEFQVFGVTGRPVDGTYLCPGTHSKWVEVGDGGIRSIRTFVTGELYRLWEGHWLATGLIDSVNQDREGFDDGLVLALAGVSVTNGLFLLRAGVVAGRSSSDRLREALSGLLIGCEIRDASASGTGAGPLTIIGEPRLADRYARAAARFGLETSVTSIHEAGLFARLRVSLSTGEVTIP